MVMTVEEKRVHKAKYIKAWGANNKERYEATSKLWRDKNSSKLKANASNYRAKKFNATIYMTNNDKLKIEELYSIANNARLTTGYDWDVDHIIPLNKGGLHKLSNLQVVPASWNRAKGDRNSDVYWG
jgi:hypothetical protein